MFFKTILLAILSTQCFSFNLKAFRTSSTLMRSSKIESNWELSLASPCKINLFLRILGRRPTGYHDLASLFQAISLSDHMHFSKLEKSATCDKLTCSDPTLSVDGSNLVVKALSLMRNKTNINQYFHVHLDKYVPIQAGLGGGSGNAATAMYAFNKLCGFPASLEDLRIWSGDIGSDITFFFTSGTAYCTGRGEIVTSMDALPQSKDTKVHVFKPKEGLSTGLVFKTLKLNEVHPTAPETILSQYTQHGVLNAAKNGYLINDLEPPSFEIEKILLEIKQDIANHINNNAISGVMMSGSGTSIYALENKVDTTKPAFDPSLILYKYPTLRHFECSFINKKDDVHDWYQL